MQRPAGRAPQAKTPALAAPLGRYRRSVFGGQAAQADPEKRSMSQKTQGRLTPKLSGRVVRCPHSNILFQNVPEGTGWHWTCLRRRPLTGSRIFAGTDVARADAASKSDAKDPVRFSALLGGPVMGGRCYSA